MNLTVPISYFSEHNPWRYEYLTFFYYYKKQVKYSFLHQFCSDSHETSTVRFTILYPLKGQCHYISTASLKHSAKSKMQYFAAEVAFPRELHNKNGTIGFSSFLWIQWYIICHERKCLKLSHPSIFQIMCQEQCQAFSFLHI